MTNCDALRDNLKAYLDGELTLRERIAVRWHLFRCPACREEILEMKDISNSLQPEDTGILDAALRTRILDGLPDAAPDAAPNDALPLPARRRNIPKLAFGVTASAVVGWFLLYPLLPSVREQKRQQAAQSNMKQMGLAYSPYVQDYDETYLQQHYPSATSARPVPQAAHDDVAGSAAPASPANSAPNFFPPSSEDTARASAKSAMRKPKQVSAGGSDGIQSDTAGEVERKVHREASLTLEVDKTEQKSDTVVQMVKDAGGYVASNQLNTEEDGTKSASLTTKIPVEKFDMFMVQLSKLGDVKTKTINGEDITEKSSDQQETLRVLDTDIRELETKVQRARHSRQDAESLRQLRIRQAQEQARMKLLRKMATLADITLELREKPKPVPPPPPTGGFLTDINETAHSAISTFTQAAKLPILVLVWAAVYLPLFLVLLLLYRVVSRFWIRTTS